MFNVLVEDIALRLRMVNGEREEGGGRAEVRPVDWLVLMAIE